MSEIPNSNAQILSEIYGYKWDSDFDNEEILKNIRTLLAENTELREFLELQRERYHRENQKRGYEASWRDYRTFTVHRGFKREFDMEEIQAKIEITMKLRLNYPELS